MARDLEEGDGGGGRAYGGRKKGGGISLTGSV